MLFDKKDLLGIKELSKEEIYYILQNAQTMKHILNQNSKKAPHLQGKSIITLFYENSTRTRLSFELAAKFLSGSASNIAVSTSSVAKGETLIDTAKTIDSMGTDVLIIRHNMSGAPHLVAKNVNASVINAGDGMNEHPTQALLDMFTMKEKKGCVEGLTVAIIGDIAHSRVARSNIYGLLKMGNKVNVFAPNTLIPKDIEKTGVTVCKSIKEAVLNADVVMGLRIQLERQKKALFPTTSEYAKFFGINDEVLSFAKKDAIIMHPGPVNRGLELSTSVMSRNDCVIDEQVTNGLAVRMALLYIFARKGGSIENLN